MESHITNTRIIYILVHFIFNFCLYFSLRMLLLVFMYWGLSLVSFLCGIMIACSSQSQLQSQSQQVVHNHNFRRIINEVSADSTKPSTSIAVGIGNNIYAIIINFDYDRSLEDGKIERHALTEYKTIKQKPATSYWWIKNRFAPIDTDEVILRQTLHATKFAIEKLNEI